MRPHNLLVNILWLCPPVLQSLVAGAMIARQLAKEFPAFLLYTLFVSARDFALFALRRDVPLYAWIYWVGEPVAVVLALISIYEVLWRLIRSYATLRKTAVRLFLGSVLLMLLLALLFLETSSFIHLAWSTESARLLDRSAWLIEVGVLLIFILFISRLGLTWKQHAAGIVAGFGISAGLQLALGELDSVGAIRGNVFPLFKSAAYNCAVVVWTAYFLPGQAQAKRIEVLPESDLARWDELLRRYLGE